MEVENNISDACITCISRRPAWLSHIPPEQGQTQQPQQVDAPSQPILPGVDDEQLSPAERLSDIGSAHEVRRFSPLLTADEARERCARDAADILAGEWIERLGADGRLGLDRPGQPVATRHWEWCTFDDLPEPPL